MRLRGARCVPNQKGTHLNTTSQVNLKTFVAARQAEKGLTDEQIAVALGYSKPNVVAMIKSGSMSLPLNKCRALATVLEVDVWTVVELALAHSPELLQVIRDLGAHAQLSTIEQNLPREVRKLTGDKHVAPIVFSGGVVALVSVQ